MWRWSETDHPLFKKDLFDGGEVPIVEKFCELVPKTYPGNEGSQEYPLEMVFQLEEAPTTKNRHYQGYLRIRSKQRSKSMAKHFNAVFFGIEIEPCKDAANVKLYCQKLKLEWMGLF